MERVKALETALKVRRLFEMFGSYPPQFLRLRVGGLAHGINISNPLNRFAVLFRTPRKVL